MKALGIKTSIAMVCNLVFANNTILPSFLLFFLIIDLYFQIPVVMAQIFNTTAELPISIGIQTNEAKAEIEQIH